LKVAAHVESLFIRIVAQNKASLTDTDRGVGVLKLRDGPHLFDDDIRVPDYQFPAQDKLDYSNPIVGFITHLGNRVYFNVITQDNAKSDLPFNGE
jgi:hypothetical protein